MPYRLPMPANLVGWSIKIYDKERLETPHITVISGDCAWRINLRNGDFMDAEQPGCKLHKRVRALIDENWEVLAAEWDKRYPTNPVVAQENDDED